MTVDFKSLKKASGASSLANLHSAVEKLATPSSKPQDDDRFWRPNVDKAGNGFAVIRFLPAPAGEDVPFVRLFDHAFQGPGVSVIDAVGVLVGVVVFVVVLVGVLVGVLVLVTVTVGV